MEKKEVDVLFKAYQILICFEGIAKYNKNINTEYSEKEIAETAKEIMDIMRNNIKVV